MERKTYPTIERDCPESLSFPLWSKLPLELLTNIIFQTTDTKTLHSWCKATQENHRLHQVAMTTRWRTVTIDDRDLLPAPGDDEEMFNETQERLKRHKLGQDWKPAGKIVNTLLSTVNNKSGRCPANYVQNLVFDFRLLRYWKDDIQNYCEPIEGDYEEDEEILSLSAHDLLPTVESLKHTLTKKLEGHFHNLRHLSCHGDTPQAMLDFVACQDAAKIRSLEMRTLGAFGRLRIDFQDEPPFQRYPSRRWPLRLEELSKLHQLRTLDIHHLSNHETAGLLAALPKLIELRCLILACEAEEHRDHYGGCALKSLFDQIFQNRDTVSIDNDSVAESLGWFPPNLKSLSLIDTHYNNYNNSVTMPFTQPPRLNSYLTHLCVDVGSVDWIPMLVDCFPEAMFQVLSVPGCSLDSDISVRGDHAYIDHAITTHKDSLNKVRLIRAWQTNRRWIDELIDRWEGTYAIQELVLGTRNPQWYEGFIRQWRERIPKPTLSHYLCGFAYDTSGESGRWGTEIRRIRIDHINIADLDVSAISEPFYSHLKILMLQPGPRGTCNNLPECEAIDKTICVELAKRIIIHGASSLRVIIIGTHWYWVSKNKADSEHDGVLWTWADAKGDSTQTEVMFSTLNEADLDFLEHSAVPWWQERDSKEWHRNLSSNARTHPHQPSKEMLNQWNYLTVLPLHEN